MNAPVNMNEVSSIVGSGSRNKTIELMNSAMKMAGEYMQNMKSMSGGQDGVPMKTITREKMDMDALRNYYTSQGLVAPTNSTDPSAQIRNLSTLYKNTSDPAQQDLLHQQALKLAQGAGWLKPGENVESVSDMAQMTNAGLPDPKYQDALIQQFFENQIKQQNANKSSSSGSSSSSGVSAADKLVNTAQAKRELQEKAAVYAPGNPNMMSGLKAAITVAEPTWQASGVDMKDIYDYVYQLMGYDDKADYDARKKEENK